MKTLLLAAAALAAMGAAAPAFAQPGDAWTGVTGYGTLGAEDINSHDANVGAVTGRLGARFGQYFGVEGELSGGFNSWIHIDIAGDAHQRAGQRPVRRAYAVGFLPAGDAERRSLRAHRLRRDGSALQPTGRWPLRRPRDELERRRRGAVLLRHQGRSPRQEYTRMTADHGEDLDANVWSLAYVRKF